MSIRFDEEEEILRNRSTLKTSRKTTLSEKLVRFGLAKDISQANKELLGFILVLVLITMYFFATLGEEKIEQKYYYDRERDFSDDV